MNDQGSQRTNITSEVSIPLNEVDQDYSDSEVDYGTTPENDPENNIAVSEVLHGSSTKSATKTPVQTRVQPDTAPETKMDTRGDDPAGKADSPQQKASEEDASQDLKDSLAFRRGTIHPTHTPTTFVSTRGVELKTHTFVPTRGVELNTQNIVHEAPIGSHDNIDINTPNIAYKPRPTHSFTPNHTQHSPFADDAYTTLPAVRPTQARLNTGNNERGAFSQNSDTSHIKGMLLALMTNIQGEHERTRKAGEEQEARLRVYVDKKHETQRDTLLEMEKRNKREREKLEEKLENQLDLARQERRNELGLLLDKMHLIEETSVRRLGLESRTETQPSEKLLTSHSQSLTSDPPPFSPRWNKISDSFMSHAESLPSATPCINQGASFISQTGSLPSNTPCINQGRTDSTPPNVNTVFKLQLDEGMHFVLHAYDCEEGHGGQPRSCTDALLDQKGSICCQNCREQVIKTLWEFVQQARRTQHGRDWRDSCPSLTPTWLLIDAWNTGDEEKYTSARDLFETAALAQFRHKRNTASDWDLLNAYIWNSLRQAMKRSDTRKFPSANPAQAEEEPTITASLHYKLQDANHKHTMHETVKDDDDEEDTPEEENTSSDSDHSISTQLVKLLTKKKNKKKRNQQGEPTLRTTHNLGLRTKQATAIADLFQKFGRRPEEDIISYLIRMRNEQAEDWDTNQYTYLVPRLWGNGQAEKKWRQSLPRKLKPLEMERRMVTKYDPNGTTMDIFVAGGWCNTPRKLSESCQSYVIRLKETKDMVNAWTNEESVSQKALLLAVRAGIQNTHMAELLLAETEKRKSAGEHKQTLPWERVEEMAEYADKMGGIRDGTPKKKHPRNKLGQFLHRNNTGVKRTLQFAEPPSEEGIFKDYDSFNTCIRQVNFQDKTE